jgi:carbon-monoxide dehydrogenase medium subunit
VVDPTIGGSMLASFGYAAPSTRAELLGILADRGGKARLLAGGTDLLVNIRAGVVKPELVVNLKKVGGYSGISWSETEGLIIRPSVTINEILADPGIHKRFPLISECARDLASYQVRNRATVIGNIVNASPCSDMAPALLCLGAKVRIASKSGERELPLREFFKGVKKTALAADEVVEAIVVAPGLAGARGSYHKLKRIKGHDLGIVGVALMKKNGVLKLGISSSAPTPVLVAGLREEDSFDTVAFAAKEATSPISDLRCSKEYREFMIGVFVKRLMAEVK